MLDVDDLFADEDVNTVFDDDYSTQANENIHHDKKITVAQFQWWERERVFRVLDPRGNQQFLREMDFNKMKKAFLDRGTTLEREGFRFFEQKRKVFRQVFMIGDTILNEDDRKKEYLSPVQGFTFRCTTGLRNRNDNSWFGIIRLARDCQKWYNKWLSQSMHILNTTSKGGLLAEHGAFSDPSQAENAWADPEKIVWLNAGGLGKVQQRDPPQFPSSLASLLEHALESINAVPGVNLEMLGVADRAQAGVLEESRKEAGITIMASFFNALRRYRKEEGRILAEFIQRYISDGRLVRIVGQEGAEFVPLAKEHSSFQFDVIIDDAPVTYNNKLKTFAVMMKIMPFAFQAGIPIPPEVLDYAPIPETLAQKWKQMINSQGQETPDQLELKQLNRAQIALELQNKKADTIEKTTQSELNLAKAMKEQALAADESAQAQQKLGMDSMAMAEKQRLANEEMLQEQARKDIELMLDARRKEIEMRINSQNQKG